MQQRGIATTLVAIGLVVLIVGALAFYLYYPRGPTSSTVYCGVFEYVAFPAKSIVGTKTISVTETVTTAISYTTSTSLVGQVGHTYSNVTFTTTFNPNVNATETAGVETICKFISITSLGSSSSST